LESFLKACADLPEDAFLNKRNRRFNVALFEAAFAAICGPAFAEQSLVPSNEIPATGLEALAADPEFVGAMTEGTTQTRNVKTRLERASAILA
jgi:hypothetical protein